jgi:hypothetical protein
MRPSTRTLAWDGFDSTIIADVEPPVALVALVRAGSGGTDGARFLATADDFDMEAGGRLGAGAGAGRV